MPLILSEANTAAMSDTELLILALKEYAAPDSWVPYEKEYSASDGPVLRAPWTIRDQGGYARDVLALIEARAAQQPAQPDAEVKAALEAIRKEIRYCENFGMSGVALRISGAFATIERALQSQAAKPSTNYDKALDDLILGNPVDGEVSAEIRRRVRGTATPRWGCAKCADRAEVVLERDRQVGELACLEVKVDNLAAALARYMLAVHEAREFLVKSHGPEACFHDHVYNLLTKAAEPQKEST